MNHFVLIWLALTLSSLGQEKPFPENRVRDFYRDQARHFLDSDAPLPAVLPAFPGLDGGKWGHWGQNPESENADPRLNEVDFGGMLMQYTRFKTKKIANRKSEAPKGVNVRVGKHTVLFDPAELTFVAAWLGDMVIWSAPRYGITSGVRAPETLIDDFPGGRWEPMDNAKSRRYHGLYRNGERVTFVYTLGRATVYDSMREEAGSLVRMQTIDGELPEGVRLTDADGKAIPTHEERLAPAGPARWADKTVVTRGQLGEGSGPYVIDTLTIPYRDANPFKTPMRLGGVGVLPDGRVAVCTLMGDVWLVSGVDDDLDQLTWRRFASGLHQPLGMVIRDGMINVIGRDQLTRLHDLNSDDEADYYECVTNDFPTEAGESCALTLHQDEAGAFYWVTRSENYGVTRFVEGHRPESIATGLRGPNGVGVSPDGKIVFALPQEGDWQPASGIFEVGGSSYHGYSGPRAAYGRHGYQMPMCFIPRGVDNSSGDVTFLPNDERFGPLAGCMLGTSFGYCQHYLVLRETIGEHVQGGVVPLTGDFLSGAHRGVFNGRDGCFYVVGTDGWQSYARENGSLQRVRYTGGALPLPTAVQTRSNGFIIRFNEAINPASLTKKRAFAEEWNYLYSVAYGSPEYSVKQPGLPGHDPVSIRSLHLLGDGRSLFVEIPQLHPVMQFHLYLELETASGQTFAPDLYYSIFHLDEPFTEFPGYEAIAKDAWNDFPIAGENPVDPRLVAQENLGKIVGDEEQLAAIVKREIRMVAGLQFEPTELTVPAGKRIALSVTNEDIGLPHNWVLTDAASLTKVGEGSMKLAAQPDGAAKHYVIDDAGVLAMSPLLYPGSHYTVYFNAPEKPGDYPFLCTFPGHWQITRGLLHVAPE